MIVLLNGAFGVGKTTVARLLVSRLTRAAIYDPEIIGIALQRTARLAGRTVDDFQDLAAWRRLTIAALRTMRLIRPTIVVPMAISNYDYLQEILAGIGRFEPQVRHFCLIAPVEVVHARLRGRGADATAHAWQYRRASECCLIHQSSEFAQHVLAADRGATEIANELAKAITGC